MWLPILALRPGGCGLHQCNYMSSCLCCSHAPTLSSETGEDALASHEEAFCLFQMSAFLWRHVKHKMTVSPGHVLLSGHMRPPDVLWLQLTGCSLSWGQCTSFFFCLFVLMHLVERAGVSVLVGLELEASFSKTKILPFPTLLSALERNGSFFPFI